MAGERFPNHNSRAFPIDLSHRAFPSQGGGVPNVPSDEFFSSVVLLLDLDGTDAATSTTDASDSGHAITFSNQAQLDTAQAKFGASSLLLDGTGDVVTAPQHTDFDFGAGDWTAEGHFRWNADTTNFQQLINKWDAPSNERSWGIVRETGPNHLDLWLSTAGTDFIKRIEVAWSPTLDVWYHIAADFDGTTYRLYVDGVVIGSSTTTVTLFDATAPVGIGGRDDTNFTLNGWCDNIRVTKGVARYAGAFTPPSSPYLKQ